MRFSGTTVGLLTLVTIAVLGVAGCGDSSTSNAGPVEQATNAENRADTANNGKAGVSDVVTQENGVTVVRLTGNDQIQYNVDQFTVPAGGKVRLQLTHVGEMAIQVMGHNAVILEQGTNPVVFGTRCAANGGTVKNDYLPKSMRDPVIAHTDLLGGGESDSVTFTAPEKTGDYPFVCTFTGHSATMNGTMVVK